MKRIFNIVCLILTAKLAFSQTEKGHWLLGVNVGSGGFSNSKSESNEFFKESESKSFTISAGPSALYFVHNNLAIGATIELGYTTAKYDQINIDYPFINHYITRAHSINVAINPEIRKYFGKPGSKGQPWVNVFGGGNSSIGKSKLNISANKSETQINNNGWNVGAGVGYAHFFNQHVALQYFINFRHSFLRAKSRTFWSPAWSEIRSTTKNNSINFGVGLQIHLSKKRK